MARFPADHVAQTIRSQVPTYARWSSESASEMVQATVWLVGLATAFLGLILAQPDLVRNQPAFAPWLILFALLVIVAGVALRIIQQEVTASEQKYLTVFEMALWSLSEDFRIPLEIQDHWTKDEIIVQLREQFEVDFTPIVRPEHSIELYRNFYLQHHELWERHAGIKEAAYDDLFRASQGLLPKTDEEKALDAAPDASNEPLRSAARQLKIRMSARNVAALLLYFFFASLSATLALALLALVSAI